MLLSLFVRENWDEWRTKQKEQDNSELYFEKQNTAKDSTIFLNTS